MADMSLSDAAAMLRISTRTLQRWIDSGRIPARRTLGGHRRVDRNDVLRLKEQLDRERNNGPKL